MIRLALYLAFGVLFHLIFIGSRFDPANLWSWLWLLGWPVALLFSFGLLALALGAIAFGAIWAWERVR